MNLKKYILLAALPVAFTACQDDVLVENHDSEQGITTLFGIMDDGLSDSRAQIVLGNDNAKTEQFMWNVGDKFTLFQTWQEGTESLLYTTHPFTISDDYTYKKYGTKGAFSTYKPLVDGRNYVAFYPTESLDMGGSNPEGYVSFGISDEINDNTPESWVKYFKENMYLQSIGTVTNGRRDLYFNHLCGIIRITYTNATEEDHELKGIYVNASLGVHRQFYLFEPEELAGQGNSAGYFGVTFTEKATVKAGQSEDFYILFFPPTIYGNVTTINPMTEIYVDYDVAEENNEFSSTPEYYQGKKFSYKGFEAGKCYWFKITGTGNEKLAWTKDMNGDEGEEDEEPAVDIHRAEVGTYADLLEALEVNARNTVIEFTADIAIESPITIDHPTDFYMYGYKLSLASNYSSGGEDAVFDVSTRLYIKHGNLEGKDGDKLHDYFVKLSGENANLSLRGVSLKTGSVISNAIFMDDDYLNMEDQLISETESCSCSIETSGYAIHWNASSAESQTNSSIRGDIKGGVHIESEYATLNARLVFKSGTINGNLTSNLTGGADISDGVKKSNHVDVGSSTGWDKAGLYVEDVYAYVSNEAALREAVVATQIAEERTFIYLENDITLTSPLTIKKPVLLNLQGNTLSLSSSFNWGTSDAAIFVTSEDGLIGSFDLYGRNDAEDKNVNGSIKGSTSESGKYLIKNSVVGGNVWIENTDLKANGSLNAICLEDSRLVIEGDYQTNITTGTGCYALNMLANTSNTRVNLQCMVNMIGNIGFTGEYSEGPSFISQYDEGTSLITGNLIKTGTYKDYFKVNLENCNIEGTGWYPEVSTLQELQEAAKNGNRKIILTAPLTVTDKDSEDGERVDLCFYGATVLLSDGFDWTNGAVITLTGSLPKSIYGGKIEASTNVGGKYLIKSTSEVGLGDFELMAEGMLNAIYVEDSRFNIYSATINVEQGFALDINATSAACASVSVEKNSTVKGKVNFVNNYPEKPGGDIEPSHFDVVGGLVKGNLTLTGSNKDGLEINIVEGGSIVGKGWPEMEGVTVPSGNVSNSGTSGNNFGNGGEF